MALVCSCTFAVFSQKQEVANNSLSDIIKENNIQPENVWLLIDKSDYTLSVWSGKSKLKEYPVVFGGNPVDDKLMQGDKCTPEGSFRIKSKYPHKKWSRFIWIDYPNSLSWQKHNAAKTQGSIPQNASIGGEIGIHGVPRGMDFLIDIKYNWTLGCISLKNGDAEELYEHISAGTKVEIRK